MRTRSWPLVLLVGGVIIRVAFWLISEPREIPDTGTYVEVARQLLSGNFSAYEGRRTFGYPALLLAAQQSPQFVWVLQMGFGLAISAMLYYLARQITARPSIGFLSGMSYNLNLGLLFFEGNLIPETQTTLLVVAAVTLVAFVHWSSLGKNPNLVLLMAGFLAGCAVLARPQFVFLPMLLGLWVGYRFWHLAKAPAFDSWIKSSLVASPGILMILASAAFNYAHIGSFTLSTQTGVNLMEHTIAFVELAPDRYREMRDVLVKQRDLHLAQTGRHTATWDAVPELKKVTGKTSLVSLDRELLKLSTNLVVEHPYRYLALVFEAWVSFWAVPNPKGIDEVSPPRIAEVLGQFWKFEQAILRAMNAAFLLFVAAAVISNRFRSLTEWGFVLTGSAAIVLSSSVFQAFVIGVDNARYGVTAQPLISLVVLTVLYHVWNARTVQNEQRRFVHTSSSKGGRK